MLTGILLFIGVPVLAYVGYLIWFQRCSRFHRLLREIPGPKAYPLLGTTFQYIQNSDDLFGYGHKVLNQYYPIFKDWWLDTAAVNLQHPDDLEIILTSTEHITKSFIYDFIQPWLGTGLLTSFGAKWQTRRRLLTPAFHFSSLQGFIGIFNKETEVLVEQLKDRCHLPAVDLIPLITELTLKTIAETSMGIEIDTAKGDFWTYKKAVHDYGELSLYRMLRPWLHAKILFYLSPMGFFMRSTVKTLHDFSMKVIKERSESFRSEVKKASYATRKRLAMLDLMLSAKEEGFDIDDEGIREEVDTFMFEGHDTTAVALSYIFLVFASHRNVQDEIYKEILEVLGDKSPELNDFKDLTYMERCLKECLRLYPSVPFISRHIKGDVKTATGYTIPAGSHVHMHIFDLHRNPEIYPDPERYDPDRFLPEATKNRHPFSYIPFSAGPRNCIGQKYAMLELKAVVCGVLRNFILEPVDTPKTIKFKSDLVLRCTGGIRVKFTKRTVSN